MIATRRRRVNLHLMRYVKLAIFGIVCYELWAVPLTHKFIFDGPLKPFWTQVATVDRKFIAPYTDPVIKPLIKPLHFAVQQKALVDSTKQIATLKSDLAKIQADAAANKKLAADLQKKLQAVPPTAAVAPATSNAAGAAAAGTNPATQATPSPDDVKTAAYWTSMEAENAAQIAQRLDPRDTMRIFSAMKPDAVAEIMNVLPVEYNVRLKAVKM